MGKYDRTARLLQIEHLLHQHPAGLAPDQLARMCGVSKRTIYRDLAAMQHVMNVPLWQEGPRYGLDKSYFLPPVKLSLFEATFLFLSSRLAYRYSDERDKHLESAWSKLAAILPGPLGRQVQATVAAMSHRPASDDYSRKVEILVTSWAEGRRARIWYPSSEARRVRPRLIEPYFLEPSGMSHSLYVIARDAEAEAMRTFKVERIRGIELTDEHFEVPESFDPEDYLGASWTVWREEPVGVTLRFDREVVGKVLEATWHPSQQIDHQPDGSLVWRGRVSGIVEITPWIRSWGPDVEVLEPAELRERLREESLRLARTYAGRELAAASR